MKRIINLLILLIPFFLFSEDIIKEQTGSLSQTMSLLEASRQLDIPVKKLRDMFEIDQEIDFNTSLNDLSVTETDIKKAITEYEQNKKSFYLAIVLVGMLIVFLCLFLIGFIIDRMKFLKHLDNYKIKKVIPASGGKITTSSANASQNEIAAVFTAIYLYELEVEEQSRLLLTWKRTSNSLWNAVDKFNMPNWIFFKELRRR